MDKSILRNLAKNFSTKRLQGFLRRANSHFAPKDEDFGDISLPEGLPVSDLKQLGEIPFPDGRRLIVVGSRVERELTSRAGRKAQYDIAKRILKGKNADAGLFVFYDNGGRFRMSLVVVHYLGRRRTFSHYRRYTYFIDPDLPNKTFINQLSKADFGSLDSLLEAFSIAAVTDEFYNEFDPIFRRLVRNVCGTDDDNLKWDFALLFTIRTIFLGFLQKRGWLGDNPRFLQDFWKEYRSRPREVNSFYKRWLTPLFFEALRYPPGHKVAYQDNEFPAEIEEALKMAPYLNGELFREKSGVDDQGLWLPDEAIGEFFDFLFQYNFTVEENELYDEELEVNPEFLGIIFERLLNKDLGSVYTPRVEVDLMCRWSLVKWLERQGDFNIKDLYELFFAARQSDEKRVGDFSTAEISRLIELLENIQVVDPAAGSGAFLVGMLQVLDEILDNLYNRPNTDPKLKAQQPSPYERKKRIIGRSLYGVDVNRTAVWIAQLRLWLTLFVDLPEDQRYSQAPLLPNLAFKVRRGDSLVQRVGDIDFPVRGFQGLPLSTGLKRRLKRLAQAKVDFFFNRSPLGYQGIQEEEYRLFREILRERLNRVEQKLSGMAGTQTRWLDVGPSKEEKRRAEERKALEKQRESLQRQLQALQKGDVPFLWALEFAEIFAGKGGFDVVIGNPPYLSAHGKKKGKKIVDPTGKLTDKEYKEALRKMLRMDFPEYFAKSRAQMDQFKKERTPSGRSDLYTYFYIRSLRLLNPQGVHVFICSNSWLDAGFGNWLQEFFLRKAPLYLVMDNRARRSFSHVDINTVITVSGAPLHQGEIPGEHIVRFVAFKKPFEETVFPENMLIIATATETLKTDFFRIFPVSVDELLQAGMEPTEMGLYKYSGDKWGGKYLRAPDILYKILTEKREMLRPLRYFAQIEGYIHGNNVGGSYPVAKLIESIEDAETIIVNEDSSGVIDRGVINRGNSRKIADLLYPRMISKRFAVLLVDGEVYGQKFYKIILFRKETKSLIGALLNTTLTVGFNELVGNVPWGQGAISVNGPDIEVLPIIHLEYLSRDQQIRLQSVFEKMATRKFGTIFTECGIDPKSDIPISKQEPNPLPDRKALDDIVFDILGLTEEERKEVYRSVCQLVWERISKANSLKKRQEKKHVDKEPIQESACGDS